MSNIVAAIAEFRPWDVYSDQQNLLSPILQTSLESLGERENEFPGSFRALCGKYTDSDGVARPFSATNLEGVLLQQVSHHNGTDYSREFSDFVVALLVWSGCSLARKFEASSGRRAPRGFTSFESGISERPIA